MAKLLYYRQHKINVLIDLLAVLLLFGAGIGGLIFVSHPIKEAIPTPPVLTTLDWAGSTTYFGVTEERTTIDERVFESQMSIGEGPAAVNKGAGIQQLAIWYADQVKSAESWEKLDRVRLDNYDLQLIKRNLIKVTLPQKGIPASKLYCSEYRETGFVCAYFAYSGHWYTEVWFWSGSDSWLSFSTVETLIERVNELLLSAPPTPEENDIFIN